MNTAPTLHGPQQTAALLPFAALVDAIAAAALQYADGGIASPERMVVPLGDGGVMLSMPATAADIAIHKLVNVQPANAALGLPTIHGMVTVCDAATGRPLCLLDGPELTGRRTAAVSLLALRTLLGAAPREVLLYGTGVQARHHLSALQALHPGCKLWLRGRNAGQVQRLCDEFGAAPCPAQIPDTVDAVLTLTTATEPVYDEAPRPGRVVVGVGAFKPGMAEIGKTTLDGSAMYADDPAGARHEAGDLLRAGIDWARVQPLATLLRDGHDARSPAVFKSVGTGAWDLAAARIALQHL